MYIERVPNRNSPSAVLLRESYREGDRIKKRTLANLSSLPDDVVDNMKMVLKGAKVSIESAIPSNFEIIRSLPHGHVAAILSTISRLGLSKIISPRSSRQKNLVIAMIIARIINPKSKLATCRGFNYQTCSHSLGQLLNLETAREDEFILQVVEKELEKIVKATNRERRPLFGQDKIALRVAKVLNKYKANKYYTLDIKESEFSYQRREELIAQETALDGIYVIRTSGSETVMDAPTTVKAYKSLSQVESAFRCYKSIDLKVRPIYHYKGERVKAHIFLCMLAYYVEWHLRESLAPLLFEDEEVSALTTDVIRANRSKSAIAKDRKKRNSEGLPVHSFRTLLSDLGTICLNKIRYTNSTGEYIFSKITQPTPLQQSCLDLLGVSLICTQ